AIARTARRRVSALARTCDRAALPEVEIRDLAYSSLSAGTKNAPAFDQAARNVACIAEVLRRAHLRPQAGRRLAFYLVAPRAQIDNGVFGSLLSPESLRTKLQDRVRSYQGGKDAWY